ncbi:MAG: sigma-54 dependent transcriptional regulator [Gammaproteobacteria bacterium]
MTENPKILLIDDNIETRRDLTTILNFLGEQATVGSSADWAEQVATESDPQDFCAAMIGRCDLVSLTQLLSQLYEWEPGLPFILLTDQPVPGNLPSELHSRITAALEGNFSYQPLLDALHKAKLFYDNYHRLREVAGIRDYNLFHSLVGNSKCVQKVRNMMAHVANKEVSVLITGESGTGKEVVARNLHLNSARAEKPFVPINCGAIPRELLESELFGHEKGAFTGAVAARAGRFELADGGTLFLDEIGDMPLSMQVKLLRVLQERSFERVGGVQTIQTNVRILAATHKDLEQMITAGQFREDLYYRINVFPIEMPPLRDRTGDVPLLIHELISIMEKEERGSVRFNSAAIRCLTEYDWPGNVRELANLVERMAILHPHGIVGVNDLPEKFRGDELIEGERLDDAIVPPLKQGVGEECPDSLLPLNGLDLKEYLSNLEKDLISQALEDSAGVVARAANRLHVRRTTLVEKMRKYNLVRGQEGDDVVDQDEIVVNDARVAGESVTNEKDESALAKELLKTGKAVSS